MLYYVNKNSQPNGDHEVHESRCSWFSLVKDSEYLGAFDTCKPAVAKARSLSYNANGCAYCCSACHTK